ncbi:MAG TPA: hypothetical protein VKK06_01445, partial [Terriglobia bacterium]|nr:hypothetical protein [Terriglobia bacterium]
NVILRVKGVTTKLVGCVGSAARNFGEAHLSAADAVVALKSRFGVSDHPGRFAATPPHEEGNMKSRHVGVCYSVPIFQMGAE